MQLNIGMMSSVIDLVYSYCLERQVLISVSRTASFSFPTISEQIATTRLWAQIWSGDDNNINTNSVMIIWDGPFMVSS